ncbi:hypothetical protein INR77_10475 [Erythrobacter sp. SCSIO 43205]|uniref:hypothetical protein n=1 Tax=Erythrobacter sp. SCSIO 43205 TaxID=2779361 RepID=UPI001CA9FEB4|nr:hypothetical protein [Erythrobacter sp. SCSIO 43205]UAB77240.1 hypothetical protein INR77_10475 [Erythrobacter sp. SCSIO 43205]
MMRPVRTITLAFAVTVLGATTALADPPIGSRVSRGEQGLTKRYDPRQADSPRPAVNAYLRCAASLDRSKARDVLELPYRSREQIEATDDFMPKVKWGEARTQDCFSDFGTLQIGYDSSVMVGAFSEYFFEKDFGQDYVEMISGLSPEDWGNPVMRPRNASESLGMCMAQSQPQSIAALIESEPASQGETAAIQAIAPHLGPCITEGVEAKFDKSSLRALLSFGLYRTLHQATELERQD